MLSLLFSLSPRSRMIFCACTFSPVPVSFFSSPSMTSPHYLRFVVPSTLIQPILSYFSYLASTPNSNTSWWLFPSKFALPPFITCQFLYYHRYSSSCGYFILSALLYSPTIPFDNVLVSFHGHCVKPIRRSYDRYNRHVQYGFTQLRRVQAINVTLGYAYGELADKTA